MTKKVTFGSLAALVSKGLKSTDKKFAALAEDIAEIKSTMASKDDLAQAETRLTARIDRVDTKLTKFEDKEIDKRKQLEVRVTTIEKHLDHKIAA